MKDLIPDSVFDQHIIVLGKTRSGKSSAMRLMVEHLLDREKPVCVIDPKGDWWGLKSSADGKHDGYAVVIFGGEHGDVPLNSRSGATVGELVATGNRSCIIDLGGWMPGDRTQFYIDFASTFFLKSRGRRWLVIDEVHNFCFKGKTLSPQAGMMLHWSNRIASEGLGKGMSLLAASQRPQKVHNDFLTSCETLIAMRVIHAADRTAFEEWIDGCGDPEKGQQLLDTVALMKRGEAWVWSPESGFGPKRIQFPMFKTYDSYKPQHANAGKLAGWADVDLTEVKTKLEKVVKEAEARDPAKLQTRIRELERELKSKPSATKEVQVADEKAIARAVFSATKQYREMLSQQGKAFREIANYLERSSIIAQREAARQLPQVSGGEIPTKGALASPDKLPARPLVNPRPIEPDMESNGASKLRAGAERMLAAVVQWGQMTEGQMRSHAGLKKSGTFSAYMSDLRRGQYIDERNGMIYPTDAGLEYCQHVPPAPKTTDEVLAIWNDKLRDGARRMLAVLVESGGEAISKEELGERAGLAKSGTFSAYLSDLRTARLVTVRGSEVSANRETLLM